MTIDNLMTKEEPAIEPVVKLTGAPYMWQIHVIADSQIRATRGNQVFVGTVQKFNEAFK